MSKPDKKRKKEINSTGSVSEIDSELKADQLDSNVVPKSSIHENPIDDKLRSNEISEIKKQLKDINSKLSNIVSNVDRSVSKMNEKVKDIVERDEERLKNLVTELFEKVKEGFLKSLTKQLEVLESRIFDREVENDKLKNEIKTLKSEVNHQTEENEKLKSEIGNYDDNRRKVENESNQYSRSNNIIISGVEQVNIKSESSLETAEETTKIIVAKINSIANENLTTEDIDIAHRLKKGPAGKKDIIARFKSRMTRNRILRQGKVLRSQNLFVREDLTPLNLEVFMSVKRKMKDEVKSVWSRNGYISYKDTRDVVHHVEWDDYQHWLDLPWPK
ncbi:hypothetical protein DPMN_038141 [Dreissena polymorpha]|uniref:Uncharacterized protein n=2 Tax=Dreissena polymorpha TaxID=45954 RepID=A0A9D4MGI7_DREPO|nr:hypothetical protein DPMN_038141 [Dreissena polymorpha]